jgi:DNA (cytosine-5)-methyltransferase 1
LFSVNDGEDFLEVVSSLDALGYCVSWDVLDSKNFGVPQQRKRVIIVGSLGNDGASPQEILAIAEGRSRYLEASQQTGKATARKVGASSEGIIGTITTAFGPKNYSNVQEVLEGSIFPFTPSSFAQYEEGVGTLRSSGGNRVGDIRIQGDVINTLQARMGTGGGNMPMVFPIQDGREIEKSQNGLGVGEDGAPAYTIDTHATQAVAIQGNMIGRTDTAGPQGKGYTEEGEPMFTLTKTDVHGISQFSTVRRLTPMECERLQAFPDDWTKWTDEGKEQADSHRYKQMGNAVAVSCVSQIIESLVKHHQNSL